MLNEENRDEETLEEEPQVEQEEINEEVEEEEPEQEEDEQSEGDQPDWKSEALKWKAIAERKEKKSQKPVTNNIKSNLSDKAANPDDEVVSRLSNLEMAERKRQFGYENGLSPEETDMVFKYNQNPTKEDLKQPFVKGGLEAIRRQDRVANNSPQSSAKSSSLDRKSLKDKSPEERQAAFEKYMKSKVEKKG